MSGQRSTLLFLLLLIALAIVFFLQLLIGSVKIPWQDVITVLGGGQLGNDTWRNIIIESRLPGAIAAVIAGAGLSVGGLQMQTLFRNPVADPYVLGISAGASLGVAVFILAAPLIGVSSFHLLSGWGIIISASLGAMLIFALNFIISFRLNDVVAILIIGLMLGGGIGAFIEILQSFSSNEALKNYVLWTFGSFRYVDLAQIFYLAVIVIPTMVISIFLSKPLNLMLLGDAYAGSLGLNVRLAKIMIVLTTSILAGCITAFCGPIGFVGLAVPHVARSIFKSAEHRMLIPASAIIGAIICCLCNIISSGAGSGFVLPVNAVTSLLGAPVVIWIILKQRKL